MRILHLYFQLHLPHQLNLSGKHKSDLFQDAETFSRTNETEYQPFFALLERNSQKFPEFKISLGVSGQWFEQAEKYDPELIQRLKKLINLGRVQIIASPYDFSLAWFYDIAEFESQMKLFNNRIRDYFGIDCSIFAMPELMYNDKIAKWAEQAGYSGMLIGSAEPILDWRTPNRVYDAKSRKDLRLICQNTKFSRAILEMSDWLIGQDQKSGQDIFSLPRFSKELDLDFLRGDLVNLCLDTSIFRRFRERGIIKFLDGLISEWLSDSQNRFYNALEVIGSRKPKNEISIKTTITRKPAPKATKEGIALSKKIRYSVPEELADPKQIKFEENLYNLRSQVQKTEKDAVIRDFSRLTALDYVAGLGKEANDSVIKLPTFNELSEILTNFGQKVFSLMPRPAQIAAKAGPGRIETPQKAEDFSVKVKRVRSDTKTDDYIKTRSKTAKESPADEDPVRIKFTRNDDDEEPSKGARDFNRAHLASARLGGESSFNIRAKGYASPIPDTIFGSIAFDEMDEDDEPSGKNPEENETADSEKKPTKPVEDNSSTAISINPESTDTTQASENRDASNSVDAKNSSTTIPIDTKDTTTPIAPNSKESAALDKHSRVEINLAELPEAEIIEQVEAKNSKKSDEPRPEPIPRKKKRTRHRRVIIE